MAQNNNAINGLTNKNNPTTIIFVNTILYWLIFIMFISFSAIIYCLGSLEIRKIGISFIIGYHTLNQLKEMPYVQTSTSQIFRRSKNKSSPVSRPGWSPSIPGMWESRNTSKSKLWMAETGLFRFASRFFLRRYSAGTQSSTRSW